jgi:hypothetical protein
LGGGVDIARYRPGVVGDKCWVLPELGIASQVVWKVMRGIVEEEWGIGDVVRFKDEMTQL